MFVINFFYYIWGMKVKLVYEPFSPTSEEEFYYKPSKEWGYMVWCEKKYVDYLMRVYGEIPARLNPVKLKLVNQDGNVIVSDLKVNLPEDVLGKIIDKGGDCIVSEANYTVIRTKFDGDSTILSAGYYHDEVVRTEQGLKLLSRLCVYDSEMIANSIIYPI